MTDMDSSWKSFNAKEKRETDTQRQKHRAEIRQKLQEALEGALK